MGRTATVLFFLLGLASTTLEARLGPIMFRLVYKTMVELSEVPSAKTCAAFSTLEIQDTRTNATAGRRFLEAKPTDEKPINIQGDATVWLRSGFIALARRAVLPLDAAGKPILHILLADLWVEENIVHRASFIGRLVLDVSITADEHSPPCWSERIVGSGDNYGYAGKEENYQETINRALDQALIKLLNTPAFSEKACACSTAK